MVAVGSKEQVGAERLVTAMVKIVASIDGCLHLYCSSSYRKEGLDLRDQSPNGWPWGEDQRVEEKEDSKMMCPWLYI